MTTCIWFIFIWKWAYLIYYNFKVRTSPFFLLYPKPFFLSGFSFTDTDDSQCSRGRGRGEGGEHLYSSLPIPPVHEHSDIYLQLCMWDDYYVFSIASLVTTRLILSEIYLPSYWTTIWLIDDGILISFCLLDDLV